MFKSGLAVNDAGLPTSRIEALSDGVFAIVMTLLVITIEVPSSAELVSTELSKKLLEMLPEFLSYIASFLIIGIFWVAHQRLLHIFRRSDSRFPWLNILFLMFISIIPFSTDLMGEMVWKHEGEKTPVLIYGCNLLVVGFSFFVLWWYATDGHRLINTKIDARSINKASIRILTLNLILLVLILIGYFGGHQYHLFLYLGAPLIYILYGGLIDYELIRLHINS